MHPEDFRQSMLKKMVSTQCCNDTFKVYFSLSTLSHSPQTEVMRIYYAMIAEYDAMVGTVMDAVETSGALDNTWVILTSDHGDMNMVCCNALRANANPKFF